MGIDVMIVQEAEAIASRPTCEMLDWLDNRFEDYDIRYGYVCLQDADIAELKARFANDPVGAMLIAKVEALQAHEGDVPHVIELMIST